MIGDVILLLYRLIINQNIPNDFLPCIEFIEKYKNRALTPGTYEMPGGGYANVCEYETDADSKCTKEAHRKYIDVHYMTSGKELARQAFIDDVNLDFYDEERDYAAVSGELPNVFVLKEGDMLVAYPEDAHQTRMMVSKPEKVKKIIFKIPIENV